MGATEAKSEGKAQLAALGQSHQGQRFKASRAKGA
jgi:hypothetical protein